VKLSLCWITHQDMDTHGGWGGVELHYSRHWMEVNGYLHAPAALPTSKNLGGRQSRFGEDRNPALRGIEPQTSSPWPGHYTRYTTLHYTTLATPAPCKHDYSVIYFVIYVYLYLFCSTLLSDLSIHLYLFIYLFKSNTAPSNHSVAEYLILRLIPPRL
jgi:hypothetical protein